MTGPERQATFFVSDSLENRERYHCVHMCTVQHAPKRNRQAHSEKTLLGNALFFLKRPEVKRHSFVKGLNCKDKLF